MLHSVLELEAGEKKFPTIIALSSILCFFNIQGVIAISGKKFKLIF